MRVNGRNRPGLLPREDMFSMKRKSKHAPLDIKTGRFRDFITGIQNANQLSYFRKVCSPMDRQVMVSLNGSNPQALLMFGSNNYLGFANDNYIKEKVKQHIDKYGIGVAGPPILNGYSKSHAALEQRLAALKGAEDAMIFPSGFQTNLGLISCLVGEEDLLIYDQYSHASTIDGMRLANIRSKQFRHNQIGEISELITGTNCQGQKFIGVEGLYSMDGDICPLDDLFNIARRSDSICIIDDSHGTGLLGGTGEGTIGLFDLPDAEVVHMGTFSKTFAVNGGFVAGNRDLINYLRYHARSYLFSASLSNVMVAAVLAGLDLIESEPWRRQRIDMLRGHALKCFDQFTLCCQPISGIIALKIPAHVNIRDACMRLHNLGFFVNAVEYPAVPKGQERIRISLMVHHQKSDIESLADTIAYVFEKSHLV